MGKLSIKTIFFLFLLSLAGCASYKIPIQADNHPSIVSERIPQIKLSSVLDIPENSKKEESMEHDHIEHD